MSFKGMDLSWSSAPRKVMNIVEAHAYINRAGFAILDARRHLTRRHARPPIDSTDTHCAIAWRHCERACINLEYVIRAVEQEQVRIVHAEKLPLAHAIIRRAQMPLDMTLDMVARKRLGEALNALMETMPPEDEPTS